MTQAQFMKIEPSYILQHFSHSILLCTLVLVKKQLKLTKKVNGFHMKVKVFSSNLSRIFHDLTVSLKNVNDAVKLGSFEIKYAINLYMHYLFP